MILPKGSSTEGTVGGLYCKCMCVRAQVGRSPSFRDMSCVNGSLVLSDQGHMYRYSMYATLCTYFSLCVCTSYTYRCVCMSVLGNGG